MTLLAGQAGHGPAVVADIHSPPAAVLVRKVPKEVVVVVVEKRSGHTGFAVLGRILVQERLAAEDSLVVLVVAMEGIHSLAAPKEQLVVGMTVGYQRASRNVR
jgi:hypothetical protein